MPHDKVFAHSDPDFTEDSPIGIRVEWSAVPAYSDSDALVHLTVGKIAEGDIHEPGAVKGVWLNRKDLNDLIALARKGRNRTFRADE